MAVLAVQHIRRMRGGAQGQLMLGADGHAYVVKFQNNPQHRRVLANEFLASRLARAAGLTAPDVELVEVSKWLVENTGELEIDFLARSFLDRTPFGLNSRFAETAEGRDPLGASVAAFVAAVRGKAIRPLVTGEEAVRALDVAQEVDRKAAARPRLRLVRG